MSFLHRYDSLALGTLLLVLITLHSCCDRTRKPNGPFNKSDYIKECGLLIEDSLYTEAIIDSLLTYALDCYPQFKEMFEAAMLNCPQSTIDTILSMKDKNPSDSMILNDFILPNSPNLCKLVCMRYPRYFSFKASKYSNKKRLDSLLMGYFFTKGVQLLDDPQVVLGMASFNRLSSNLKDDVDTSLTVWSLSRILQSIIANQSDLSPQQASDILYWGERGESVFSRFADTPVFLSYYEYLAESSWVLNHPSFPRYADSLIAAYSRGYHPDFRRYRKLFRGPILKRYNQLLGNNSYESAQRILDCMLNSYDTIIIKKGYTPISSIIADRMPLNHEYARGQVEWVIRLLEQGIQDDRLKESTSDYVACCFEKARLLYLKGDDLYEQWLNTAFCYGVREAFPSTTLEDVDVVLSPEHQYVQGLIPLLQLQYNNTDARAVYDAALFVKGSSDIISPSIYNAIKVCGDSRVVNYADSLRHGLIIPHPGEAHDILENNIGTQLRYVLNTCLTSWSDIKKSLLNDEIAIEFVACPSLSIPQKITYKAVILSRAMDVPRIVNLCSGDEVTDLIKGGVSSQKKMYKIIWSPLNNIISSYKTIYYAPDGLLNICNLHSAMTPDGKTMMDIKELHLLSSTRDLVSRRKGEDISSIALFGGLDYNSPYNDEIGQDRTRSNSASKTISRSIRQGSFKYLPYTLKEIQSISSISTSQSVTSIIYSGEKGTEEAFYSLDGERIDALHLATHGFYYSKTLTPDNFFFSSLSSEDNPLSRCGLILSKGQNAWEGKTVPNNCEDGVLLGSEILGVDLSDVDLVVLSACCTALGDISGEGVSGLRKAFRRAGAKSLLISLGDVDDKASYFFMENFYKSLLDGCDKQTPYQEAINSMRNHTRYNNPDYWTKFILIE